MNYLYVAKCTDFYKIGITYDLESRLADLQVGNPFPLSFVISIGFGNPSGAEKALHEKFKEQRLRGEWFTLSPQDLVAIKEICTLLGGQIIKDEIAITDLDLEDAEMNEEIAIGKPRANSILNNLGHRLELTGHGEYKRKYYAWRRPGDRAVMGRGLVSSLPDEIKEKLKNRLSDSE